MRKTSITVALLFTALSTAALAADLPNVKGPPIYNPPPPPPTWNWTGFYIGANGGYGWGTTTWSYLPTGGTPVPNLSTHGGLAGGTVGFNYEFAPGIVAGVEGDFDWADINGSTSCPNPAFACQSRLRDFGTARGRIGWALDRFLIYGTGGGAFGEVNTRTDNLFGTPVPPSGSPINGSSSFRAGWAAGVGVEYAFWNNLTAKVEYLHYDLGGADYAVDNGLFVHAHEFGNVVRAGLNWKFDWFAPPAPAPVVAKY